jgi:sporulation protein YlmC with PRC-barrel domain
VLTLAGWTVACEVAAVADEETRVEKTTSAKGEGFTPKLQKGSELIGSKIENAKAENLGRVEEVVLDTDQSRVAYVVLGTGGLDVDKKTFEANSFKSSEWPDLSDKAYTTKVYGVYKQEPYWTVYGYEGEGRPTAEYSAAWMADSEYNRKYDPKNVVSFEGTVENVGTFRPDERSAEGLRLRVKSNQGTMTVHCGPLSYVNAHNCTFYYGDNIKVSGSKVNYNGREVIFATEVTKGDKSIKFRDANGKPTWTSEHFGKGGHKEGAKEGAKEGGGY